jgi:hypothetical protein
MVTFGTTIDKIMTHFFPIVAKAIISMGAAKLLHYLLG